MRNKLTTWTSSDERSAEFIPLRQPNGIAPQRTGHPWKLGARSGVNAALLLVALCGFWLASAESPAQEATNEPTNAVVAPIEAPRDVTAESPEARTNEAISKAAATSQSSGLKKLQRHGRGGSENAKVVIGKDVEVKENESVGAVVVIGGNALVEGKVQDAAVVIGGNLSVRGSGEVGDAVVAIMGNVELDDRATVHGDAVAVGGTVQVAGDATVEGERQSVDFGALGLPQIEPLRKWFLHCVLKLRPLAPQVGWVWAVAGIFFLLYLLAAVALPKPVQACVGELSRRPATTFLMGLVAEMLLPIVLLILAATGIGVFIIPFVAAAVFFGAIIGKVAFMEYLGSAVPKLFGVIDATKPIIAFVIGAIILALLYCVPVLGLITLGVTGMWGLGAAVTAGFGSLRRESPEKSNPPPVTTPPPEGLAPIPVAATPAPGSVTDLGVASTGFTAPPQTTPTEPQVPLAPSASVPEALVHPRASFWERMGAAFLDVVLVSILGGLAGSFGLLVALAYFAGMWAWKGTTIGGIVLNLKVVRLDGSPMTFAAALVRGLAAAFSVIVFFLGFLWIIWDREKQGWHDRIAGTVVVRLPRGLPLVCL